MSTNLTARTHMLIPEDSLRMHPIRTHQRPRAPTVDKWDTGFPNAELRHDALDATKWATFGDTAQKTE